MGFHFHSNKKRKRLFNMNYVTEKEMKQRLHISAVIHTERKN